MRLRKNQNSSEKCQNRKILTPKLAYSSTQRAVLTANRLLNIVNMLFTSWESNPGLVACAGMGTTYNSHIWMDLRLGDGFDCQVLGGRAMDAGSDLAGDAVSLDLG